ncbi:RNase H domain-containing protein [Trichonephila clavipes]|nr:RNase H domain-containing protein [Trichonephila clavipes]
MKDAVIEIKMAQHRPRKPAFVEYTTDEEDIIVNDMGEEIESSKNGSTWFAILRHYESTVQQGFRYRVLLATKSRSRIIGNEQADSAAMSATTHLPLAVPLSDMKRVIMHHISKLWQESAIDNKTAPVKPVIGAWPVMPMQRTDVKLTRLRIGHTRYTHRHLLFGETAPECPSCKVFYTVRHILIDCPF